MMVMTAKVNFKKILLVLTAIAGIILALVLLLGGGESEATSANVVSVPDNNARVQFLKDFGWEVAASPTESSQVKIPEALTEVYQRYNALQKSQGYDLTQYAGKTVMRYVYKINNFPNATDPVYATLLVYKNQVIGGDVTNTGAKGVVQGFRMLQTQPVTDPTVPPDTQSTEPAQQAPSSGSL